MPVRARFLSRTWLFVWLAAAGLIGLVGFSATRAPASHRHGVSTAQASLISLVPAPGKLEKPRTARIELVQVGQKVLGENPELTDTERSVEEPDPATWRHLKLRMLKADHTWLAIELLRSLGWIAETRATAGGTIQLDLPELGAAGPATVLSIGPCPAIEKGPGHVATGTFAHEASNVIDLVIEGSKEPIGCTANHPFWSEDRQEFIPVGELRPGERLRSQDGGTARVVSFTPRANREAVYNLEVQGEHVYLVGSLGTLVHNSYVGMGKAINLPAWRKVTIDMEHVASGHMLGGSRVSSLKTMFPSNWTRVQVERAIRQAYRGAERVASQGDRVLVRGTAQGVRLEMWINKATKMIETAYPLAN